MHLPQKPQSTKAPSLGIVITYFLLHLALYSPVIIDNPSKIQKKNEISALLKKPSYTIENKLTT